MFKVYLEKHRTSWLLVGEALLARETLLAIEALLASEELEPVGRVTVRGTGHRTVTSPYNNTSIVIIIVITIVIIIILREGDNYADHNTSDNSGRLPTI